MKPEDAQLLEILIDGDNTDRIRQTREGGRESPNLCSHLCLTGVQHLSPLAKAASRSRALPRKGFSRRARPCDVPQRLLTCPSPQVSIQSTYCVTCLFTCTTQCMLSPSLDWKEACLAR